MLHPELKMNDEKYKLSHFDKKVNYSPIPARRVYKNAF